MFYSLTLYHSFPSLLPFHFIHTLSHRSLQLHYVRSHRSFADLLVLRDRQLAVICLSRFDRSPTFWAFLPSIAFAPFASLLTSPFVPLCTFLTQGMHLHIASHLYCIVFILTRCHMTTLSPLSHSFLSFTSPFVPLCTFLTQGSIHSKFVIPIES